MSVFSGKKNKAKGKVGHRIAKHVLTSANVLEKSTYYILDAQGNTMAVYERAVNASNQSVTFEHTEKHIFGSSRLGAMNVKVPMLGSQNTSYSMINKKHRIGERNYELSNHLNNVLSVISDKPVPHSSNGTTHDYYMADIMQSSDYSAFGVTLSGRNYIKANTKESRRGFSGKEEDDEIKGDGNSYDFGARMLDPRLGRWLSIDPLARKYPHLNPYCFVGNMPTIAIDPDGKRIYFIGGAGNDSDGWNYINRFIDIFKSNWMEVKRVDASHGQAGDIAFTMSYRSEAWVTEIEYASNATGNDITNPSNTVIKRRVASVNPTVKKAVEGIMADLKANPLGEGETFDLMGYSYGSVEQAHIALALADRDIVVDNLVLVGSPISDDSDLMKELLSNKNIKNVVRYDIPGDMISNPDCGLEFAAGGLQNLPDSGHHYDLARPGQKADSHINALARVLRHKGVGKPPKGSLNESFYNAQTEVDKVNAESGLPLD